MRIGVGMLVLVVAAALLAHAGDIDIASPAAWQNILKDWTLPSREDNVRGIYLLLGALAVLLALARLLTPMSRSYKTSRF